MMRSFVPQPIRKAVTVPPSKSLSHRYLLAAALADGECAIENLSVCDDVLATLDCLCKCGVDVKETDNVVSVYAKMPEHFSDGLVLDCKESGSTLRFLIPLLLRQETTVTLIGAGSLFARPLSVYENICKKQGLIFERIDSHSLKIGGVLRAGNFVIPGDVSSQFVTGLLFALPLIPENSRIELLPPVESRPYIDLTLSVLSVCGIRIQKISDTVFVIPGGQTYRPFSVTVEGDHSAAAYFHALNALPENRISILGLNDHSLQGDAVFPTYLDRIKRSFCTLAVNDCPDLAPVLLISSLFFHGCTLTGTRRLRIKESNRISVMTGELSKCGIDVNVCEDSMTVRPDGLHAPDVPLDSHGDHRIAMALSVLLAATGGSLLHTDAVSKSFPDFYSVFD